MNIEDVNAYLEKNNWKFEKISGEEPPKLGILQYKLLSETDSNLVIARLFLYYKGNSIKRLTNIFINTGIYYNYLNDLEKINAKKKRPWQLQQAFAKALLGSFCWDVYCFVVLFAWLAASIAWWARSIA